ncbi:MAG: GDP-mannose 4,6-dehydratase [Anaerolineales bacterium]|nr:GDP-mannose 4,6-dehydratase [Anaerolineales bacterium]
MPVALITGISGFVGKHLQQRLAGQGWQVYGFDVRSGMKDVFVGDLTDRAVISHAISESKPDVIIHLAGVIKSAAPEIFYKVNLLGTLALLDAVVESGLHPKIVAASSSAVYGRKSGERPISERVQLHPVTDYAVSKVAQEAAALRYYYDSYALPVMIVRMFNLLGPGQPADLACSAFARQIALAERSGQTEIVTGNLDARRDFVDVRDAVRAFELIAQKGKPGQIYNVCSERGVAIRKCLREMMSMSTNQLSARVDADRVQKDDVPVQVGSYQKLRKAMGWSPKISLHQSLTDLLNDWRVRVAEVESK